MIKNLLVLGSGSAGLLAALTVKRVSPQTAIRIVRSPEIGVIGVGEATTPNLPVHLFDFLRINRKRFYAVVEPSWKMGIHFLWGKRPYFDYAFEPQLDVRAAELPRPNGYYCDEDFANLNLNGALMREGKAFTRQPNGGPDIPAGAAFHLENKKFVKILEITAVEQGIEFIDANVKGATRGPSGIAAVILEDGRSLEADFYIDASGFRSELLGKTLEEPYISYSNSLFNDRALVGSWDRAADEPNLPYTTAETMNSGWCWRIDHQQSINRGYVYSSAAISDDDARTEFLAKNPKAKPYDRIIKFRSGRYQRAWVGNTMAIGNASGFVEPLESTSLMVVAWQCRTFVELIHHVGPSPSIEKFFNEVWARTWDEVRDFLTLHFWANKRLDTPYWQHCNNDTDISHLQPLLDFYTENGPTGYARYLLNNTGSQFGIEGFLVMLVGCQVPYQHLHIPAPAEWDLMSRRRTHFAALAQKGMGCKEALQWILRPDWHWLGDTR